MRVRNVLEVRLLYKELEDHNKMLEQAVLFHQSLGTDSGDARNECDVRS